MSSFQYNSGNGGDFPPSPPDIMDLIAPQDSVQPSMHQENRKVVLEQRTETVQQQQPQQPHQNQAQLHQSQVCLCILQ